MRERRVGMDPLHAVLGEGKRGGSVGDAMASGWMAEHTSCTKPGNVSAFEREPPPISAAASTTRTRQPTPANTAAATSPLGPAPTTTAS